jgi:hypothetical protein
MNSGLSQPHISKQDKDRAGQAARRAHSLAGARRNGLLRTPGARRGWANTAPCPKLHAWQHGADGRRGFACRSVPWPPISSGAIQAHGIMGLHNRHQGFVVVIQVPRVCGMKQARAKARCAGWSALQAKARMRLVRAGEHIRARIGRHVCICRARKSSRFVKA